MSLVKIVLTNILAAGIVFLFFAYAPFFLDINPTSHRVELLEKFEKGLAYNDRLSAAEKLFEGKIVGPESLALHKGSIYTGLHTGEIIKIDGDKYTVVTHTGEKGKGRSLGLRFDKKGVLYACDAYYGLYSIDIKSGKVTLLLKFGEELNGRKIKFLDDLDIDDDGMIYMSDASTRWNLEYIMYIPLEHDNTGRIITYDTKTGKSSVLVDNLYFPNGVQLTRDKSGLLIAELLKLRILKYNLRGPKKGQLEVFATLPGEPDNIRLSPRGGYWVALVGARNTTSKLLIDHSTELPLVRKVAARLLHAVGSILEYLTVLWPSPVFQDYAQNIKNGRMLLSMAYKSCLIAELDERGQVVQSLHSSDLSLCLISEVLEKDGHLYFGSFIHPFLRRVKL